MLAIVIISVIAFVISFALAGDTYFFGGHIKNNMLGDDAYKALLQLSLVGLLGGLATFYINKAKAASDTLNEMRKNLITSYREIKRIRRMMRPLVDPIPAVGCRIEEKAFLEFVENIQDAQLTLEILRDNIASRPDVIPRLKARKLIPLIYYAHRYLHDVFAEYEKRKAVPKDGFVVLGQDCPLLIDFIESKSWPPIAEAAAKKLKLSRPEEGRYSMFQIINSARQSSGDQADKGRYSNVATFSLRMAIKIL